MKRIALKDFSTAVLLANADSLLSEILLFDLIYYDASLLNKRRQFINMLGFDDTKKRELVSTYNKIDDLTKHGLIKPVNINLIKPDVKHPYVLEVQNEIKRFELELYKDVDFQNIENKKKWIVDIIIAELSMSESLVRLKSALYNNGNCTPILSISDNPIFSDHIEKSKHDTVHVILNNIPTISPNISITQLKEFKADNDAKDKFLALRNFMISLSKETMTENEMHERVEYLLNEYEQQLKLHKAKLERSTLETILLTTAEVAENAVRLKFSTALKAILDINKKQIELLEAERKFNGREVAYIHKIKTELGDKN